ncbi:MAG: SDR family NAD(P)-dependent oxidoreductase [Propionicimonas sp.]|uniref:SDR family NAD(P)-dependent oxidoreductase n=1 Tax=Propionicimonas sp. TaxID=1955623 RepID=UPI002B1F4769|nr:SDR family NAD(P)-dependent oxidoreductase [Propionicimonas sp.]MEA4944429.1 SDR family NAD(P)-dependent oxidoreductase [Propionicimonas sp.]
MPVIAVFGAGPGLGSAVARRYAREGYDIVLIGRRPEPLQALAAELTGQGVTAHAVTGDLSDPAGVGELAARVRAAAGEPDVIYYAPVSSEVAFVPAAQQSAETAQQITNLLYFSLVAVVQEFLPHMLAAGGGAILTAQGASALAGLPGMSGPGPAAAAQRNYLQSLAAEVGGQGVFVGRLYISSIIGGSAIDQRMQAARAAGVAIPPSAVTPAGELADRLWSMRAASGPNEEVVPEANPFVR